MDDRTEILWLSYKHFGNMEGTLTDKIVAEQNWQTMIDEIWNNRQVSDDTGKNLQKRDFMRSRDHSCIAQHISIEDMMENGVSIDGEQLYEMEDPHGEIESKVVSEVYIEQFQEGLTKQDGKILQMRCAVTPLRKMPMPLASKPPMPSASTFRKMPKAMRRLFPKPTANSRMSTHKKDNGRRQSRFSWRLFVQRKPLARRGVQKTLKVVIQDKKLLLPFLCSWQTALLL